MSDVFAKNIAISPAEAAKIVPRAEFRVFGHGIIDVVRERMWNAGAVLWKTRKMPAETYFLSARSDEANVKVREGLLDIKIKVGETPAGYEIFQPRGKFSNDSCRREWSARGYGAKAGRGSRSRPRDRQIPCPIRQHCGLT